MSVSKSNVSITKKRIRRTARALIKRRNTSAAYAALKSASTLTLRALTASATRKIPRGARIIAASPTPIE